MSIPICYGSYDILEHEASGCSFCVVFEACKKKTSPPGAPPKTCMKHKASYFQFCAKCEIEAGRLPSLRTEPPARANHVVIEASNGRRYRLY